MAASASGLVTEQWPKRTEKAQYFLIMEYGLNHGVKPLLFFRCICIGIYIYSLILGY